MTKIKKFSFIGLIALMSLQVACSHMTPFEACNEVDEGAYEWQKYGSVEECISEKKIARARGTVASRFFSGFSQGYNQTRSQQQQNTNLTCRPNYSGGMNCN